METTPTVYMLTRAAVRELDRLAVEQYAIPSIVLMENAARHIAEIALQALDGLDDPLVAVYCGPGNNGGDGLAAARHLHNAGVRVQLVLAAAIEAYQGDAGVNLGIARRMNLPIFSADAPEGAGEAPAVVVDALLGTGLDRKITGPMADLIAGINALRKRGSRVIAVDVPSGLDADTGEPLGIAVRADVTVTFVGPKTGLCSLAAQPYVGDLIVADIGAPRSLTAQLGTPIREVPPDHF